MEPGCTEIARREIKPGQKITMRRPTTAKMQASRVLALCLAAGTVVVALASEPRVSDQASAVEAAKRYLKARCTADAPCKFKAEREASQWRVWVELPRKSASRGPGQQIVLFFDVSGNLIRRLEVE